MKLIFILFLSLFLFFGCQPQVNQEVQNDTESLANEERMAWWKEARFGLFIHWGLYAVPAGEWKGEKIPGISEWIMLRAEIPVKEYEKLVEEFNPVKFNAEEWVSLAKVAGMKYIVITSKHHDGFAMFHSKVNPYNIVDATPFDRDPLRELADECEKQGIKLGFYHSQAQDWHHPGGTYWGMRNDEPHWDPDMERVPLTTYIDEKAYPQVKEILTNYGNIAIMWWDTPIGMTEEAAGKLHELLALQPGIIENNRLYGPWDGDFSTPEQHIPPTGLDYDWEVCMTMNTSWGYKYYDNNWKSTETLIQYLADIASKGGNFLLNVGPTAEGLIPQPSIERLREIGEWMGSNGESIYGTSASPFFKLFWGRCTKKEDGEDQILYLHVFDFPENGRILVPGLRNEVKSVQILRNSTKVPYEDLGNDILIDFSGQIPDPYITVLKMEIKGKSDVISNMPEELDGRIELPAAYGFIHNRGYGEQAFLSDLTDKAYISHWVDAGTRVEFMFSVKNPGEYDLSIKGAAAEEVECRVETESDTLEFAFQRTGKITGFEEREVGIINLEKPGTQVITLIPAGEQWNEFRLEEIRLVERKEGD